MARAALTLALAAILALGCGSDLELLPTDASEGDSADAGPDTSDAASDAAAPARMCFDSIDCDACPMDGCGIACRPFRACNINVPDGATNPISCDDGAICGQAAEALVYCRADEPQCVVTADAPAEITCLDGACRARCDAGCTLDCPAGDCSVRCTTTPCEIRRCPVAVERCSALRVACGASCAG